MYEEKWDKGKDKEKEKECGCRIKVEDSIVILLCGEIEFDRMRGCIHSAIEAKNS